jgi:6-phosphogluconolactonase (cycloisomerase 2 family)
MKAMILVAGVLAVACFAGCGGGSTSTTIGGGLSVTPLAYVVGPTANNVFAFQQTSAGGLKALSTATFATGSSPSAFAANTLKTFAYVTDAGSNDVRIFTMDPTTGLLTSTLSPVSTGTNPISVIFTGNVLMVLNKGSASISTYLVDAASGGLTQVAGSPFATPANPVAMVLTTKQNFVYVLAPGVGHASVTGYAFSSSGVLTPFPGLPFTAGTAAGGMAIDLVGGRFLYVTDPASNNVLGFSVQSATGILTPLPGSPFTTGTNPAGVAIDSSSAVLFVANQGSNNISAFTIGSSSGTLTPVFGTPPATGTGPAFITVDATNEFLYVANPGSSNISAFTVSVGGALTPVAGSPFSVGTTPVWITTTH